MSNSIKSISIDRCVSFGRNAAVSFWLIDSLPIYDSNQMYLYVNEDSDQEIQYVDRYKRCTWPMDSLFDLSTPESVIQSLWVFHHDFLTQHCITIDMINTEVKAIESVELPEGFESM